MNQATRYERANAKSVRSSRPPQQLHIEEQSMTFSCFTVSTGHTLRRIRDAVERRLSATEMVSPVLAPPRSVARPRGPPGSSSKANEKVPTGPSASSILIMYDDENCPPPPPKRAQRFRLDPDHSVSVLTDVTEGTSDVSNHPTASGCRGDIPKLGGFLSGPSPTDTILLHDWSPRGFQSASESPIVSSPPTRHPFFAPRTKQDHPSSSTHRNTSSYDLRQKCSQLKGEREMYAEYLESAIRKLHNARQQLKTTRNTLAEREDDILDLRNQVRNMKRGMETAMNHYNSMARELNDMKGSHADCSLNRRSSACKFFRTAVGTQVRDLQRALSKARYDVEMIQEQSQDAHRSLVRAEIVLHEQREYMKVRIRALRHTRDELAVVRGKLESTARELEDRKFLVDVLRQNNRDLILEIACLKHRDKGRKEVRNFTV